MLRIRIPRASLAMPAACIAGLLLLTGCDTQAAKDFRQSTVGAGALLVGANEEEPAPIDPNAPPPRPDVECPSVAIRDGTQTYRIYARGHDGDPAYLVLQGSITKTARECTFEGDTALTMKLGIAGRALLGPEGHPGTFTLPIRAAFVRPGGEAVWSDLYRVTVTVPQGQTYVDFTQVADGISYQIPPTEVINNYVLYVGFDERSAR